MKFRCKFRYCRQQTKLCLSFSLYWINYCRKESYCRLVEKTPVFYWFLHMIIWRIEWSHWVGCRSRSGGCDNNEKRGEAHCDRVWLRSYSQRRREKGSISSHWYPQGMRNPMMRPLIGFPLLLFIIWNEGEHSFWSSTSMLCWIYLS